MLVSTEADQEEFDRMVRILGLDQPLWKQTLIYVSNLAQGDFGRSFAFSEPALKLVSEPQRRGRSAAGPDPGHDAFADRHRAGLPVS